MWAEYEALLVGLWLAKEMHARNIEIKSDSQLVVNQVNETFTTKGKKMIVYLTEAIRLLQYFDKFELTLIPRKENEHANDLLKLANSKDA